MSFNCIVGLIEIKSRRMLCDRKNRRSNLPDLFYLRPQANRRVPRRNLTAGDPPTSVCRCHGDATARRTARTERTRKTAHLVSLEVALSAGVNDTTRCGE